MLGYKSRSIDVDEPFPLPSAELPLRAESEEPGERRLPRLLAESEDPGERRLLRPSRPEGAGVGAAATEAARAMKAVVKMVLESIFAVVGCLDGVERKNF